MPEKTPIEMLKMDHQKVENLFNEYELTDMDDYEKKEEVVMDIIKNFEVHAQLEEDMFYPKLDEISEEGSKMKTELIEQHNAVRNMIAKLEEMETNDPNFDRQVLQIKDEIINHVDGEEDEIFPFMQEKLGNDIGIGFAAKMMAHKQKLKLKFES